jgi:hypothetical protein
MERPPSSFVRLVLLEKKLGRGTNAKVRTEPRQFAAAFAVQTPSPSFTMASVASKRRAA